MPILYNTNINKVRRKYSNMTNFYGQTIESIIEDLEEIGIDPSEYTDEQLNSMLKNGFCDE